MEAVAGRTGTGARFGSSAVIHDWREGYALNAPPDNTASDASAAPNRLEQRFTSHPANIAPTRRAVEAFAAGAGFDEKTIGDIGLCVNEALANVIRHAYAGRTDCPVLLIAEILGDGAPAGPPPENSGDPPRAHSPPMRLQVTIRDWGSGVNPASLPIKQHDPLLPGGLGLVCLRHLMDQVVFSPQPDGMLLTLVKERI
jgi:anti-sigma regulatory factor (Ser/Thr protein kinase)